MANRKQFLEMMAGKARRAKSRDEVESLVNECAPHANITISCPDGIHYRWRQNGEELSAEIDLGDRILLQYMVLNSFRELREFASDHILTLR